MHIVYYDLVVGLPKAVDGSYVMLLFYDGFSRFVVGVPLASEKAEYIVKKVMEHFIGPFGYPWAFHSDNGKNMDGHLVRYLAQMLGITKTTTPPYTPNSNPCETMCGAVTMLIRKALYKKDQRQWPLYVPFILNALNSTVHTATGYTPRNLFFGRFRERDPVPLVSTDSECANATVYMSHLRRAQQLQWQLVRSRSQKLVEKRREKANEKLKPHPFKVGDFVLIKNLSPALGKGQKKLRAKYIGPFRVVHVYPRTLIVVPWRDSHHFKTEERKSKWFKFPNRGDIRPYSARPVNVGYCKPFRSEVDEDLFDQDLLQEFLDSIEAGYATSNPSIIESRSDDSRLTDGWRAMGDDHSRTRTISDSSDDDDDPDDNNDWPAAPGAGGSLGSNSGGESINPQEVLDEMEIDPDDRIRLQGLLLDRDQYDRAAPEDRHQHDEVADILQRARSADAEVREQAEFDAVRLLDQLMEEEERKAAGAEPMAGPSVKAEAKAKPERPADLPDLEEVGDELRGPLRPGEFVVSTPGWHVQASPTIYPGQPRVIKRGGASRTSSATPSPQDGATALTPEEQVTPERQRAQANPSLYQTKSGRTVKKPDWYDPSAYDRSRRERLDIEKAKRLSLGDLRNLADEPNPDLATPDAEEAAPQLPDDGNAPPEADENRSPVDEKAAEKSSSSGEEF